MKKLLLSSLAVAALSVASLSAQAATVAGPITVSVTLNAVCTINSPQPVLDFGSYTAFGPSVTATPSSIKLSCTRSLVTPTVAITGGAGGTVAGLNYQIAAADGVVTPGSAAGAAVGAIGSADSYSYALTGTMAANQAGDCAGLNAAACAASAVTATRTLTFTY